MNLLSDEKTFLKMYHLDEVEYNRTGLKWKELCAIYEAYLKEMPQYRMLESYFSDCLRTVANVHSVITRLKEPERLIEALIRRKMVNKELAVNSKNYNEIATDLIEIRVLHLFKEDWESIHEYITNKWVLKGKPIAYAYAGDGREADGRDFLARFQERGCDVRYHELGYRSIAYLAISSIDNKTNYVEILSRTIFEEGWNSIDSLIRDSHDIDNPALVQYLSRFSHRIADLADEMGSFLHSYLNEEQGMDGVFSPSGMEVAQIARDRSSAGNGATAAAPQQEFLSPLTNLLRRRETPSGAKQDEHPKKPERLPDTYQTGHFEQQQAPPGVQDMEPAPPAVLGLAAAPGLRPPVRRILANRAVSPDAVSSPPPFIDFSPADLGDEAHPTPVIKARGFRPGVSPDAEETIPGRGTHTVGGPPEGGARSDTAPARPARSAELDGARQTRQDEFFKIQPDASEAQKNDRLKEQENSQKFTLSKLKQAIQGITPKNS